MRQKSFGKLPPVSALTLGGGGIGMVWGETTSTNASRPCTQQLLPGSTG